MNNSIPSKLNFRVFRAVEDQDSSKRYLDGHMHVLKIFGITQITSAKTDWMLNPNMYVILVESESKDKVYAGARIQIAGNNFPLPIEDAIGKMDPNIFSIVKNNIPFGAAELCGLWNSREVAGMGIGSIFLGRASISITNQLNINKLFALCAPSTYRNCIRTGFEVLVDLGKNGQFYYPKEDLLATSLLINDTQNLNTAVEEEKQYIFNLRNQPVQTIHEQFKEDTVQMNFDLRIKK